MAKMCGQETALSVLIFTTITVLCCHCILLRPPVAQCNGFRDCLKCQQHSEICGWCDTPASSGARCVALTSLAGNATCWNCPVSQRGVVRREVHKPCDDSQCAGLKGETCSGHGRCTCGTCLCEPRYRGRVCHICPTCWEYCAPLAKCARCLERRGNSTLCPMCPEDTEMVTADPDVPEAAECVFDSLSLADDSQCSFHVYYWHDDQLNLHGRIRSVCGSVAEAPIFGGGGGATTKTKTPPSSPQMSVASASTIRPKKTTTSAQQGQKEQYRSADAESAKSAAGLCGSMGSPWILGAVAGAFYHFLLPGR